VKEDMLRWLFQAIMSEPISERKRIAFLEWLTNEEHAEMKLGVIDSAFISNFEQ
jgi:hypothetical protein